MILDTSFVIRAVLSGLSLFAVTVLLTKADGLHNFLLRWRLWMASHDIDQETGQHRHGIDILVSCPFCLSVWMLPFFALPVFLPSLVGDIAITLIGILGFHYALLWQSTPL